MEDELDTEVMKHIRLLGRFQEMLHVMLQLFRRNQKAGRVGFLTELGSLVALVSPTFFFILIIYVQPFYYVKKTTTTCNVIQAYPSLHCRV